MCISLVKHCHYNVLTPKFCCIITPPSRKPGAGKQLPSCARPAPAASGDASSSSLTAGTLYPAVAANFILCLGRRAVSSSAAEPGSVGVVPGLHVDLNNCFSAVRVCGILLARRNDEAERLSVGEFRGSCMGLTMVSVLCARAVYCLRVGMTRLRSLSKSDSAAIRAGRS